VKGHRDRVLGLRQRRRAGGRFVSRRGRLRELKGWGG
jgi:hypothetical protein